MNDLKNAAGKLKKQKSLRKSSNASAGSLKKETSTKSLVSQASSSNLSREPQETEETALVLREADEVKDNFDDDDSSTASLALVKARGDELIQALTINTKLKLIDINGNRKEKQLGTRVMSYSDLQREVALLFPHSRELLMVQNSRGERIFSSNFIPSDEFVVRSLHTKPPAGKIFKTLNARWETEGYHDAVHQMKMNEKKSSTTSLFF
jgi:hypothetical protein